MMYNLSQLNDLGLNYTEKNYSNGATSITVVVFDKLFKSNIIGIVISDLFEYMVPLILVEKDENAVDFAYLGCAKGGRYPRISFENEYCADLRALTNEVVTVIFHELGHFYNGDLTNGSFNFEAYHAERVGVANTNIVHSMELKADDFAASFLGNTVVADGLTAVKIRTEESYTGYENVEIAVSELEERIKRLM